MSLALKGSPEFNFQRDVLPEEFIGLLDKKKRVVDVERPEVELVKNVIESIIGRDEGGEKVTGL